MGKVVLLNIPAFGHINPTLGLTRELVAAWRGSDLLCLRTVFEHHKNTGARFKSYEKYFQFDQEKMIRDPLTLVNYLMAITVKNPLFRF